MRPFIFVALVLLPSSMAAGLAACSSDPAPVSIDNGKDSGGATDSSTAQDTNQANDTGSTGDTGACAFSAPVIPGTGICGTLDFGQPAANAVMPEAGTPDGGYYIGGTIAPGIYDAVLFERGSSTKGSWRETFVVAADGKFTRIRQVDTGAGSGPGPISYRAGTISTSGSTITLHSTCVANGDAGAETGPDAGNETNPFAVRGDSCHPTYQYGGTGIGITLQRRP